MKKFIGLFIPKKCNSIYKHYAYNYFKGSIASSFSSTLSTQSLLYAVGVGSEVAIPMGGVLWTFKDSISNMATVLLIDKCTNGVDLNPKSKIKEGIMLNSVSSTIEIMTPLFPTILFVPIASVANIGHGVSFTSISASRAVLHSKMNMELGQLTAKATSQAIFANAIGTMLACAVSYGIGGYDFALFFPLHISATLLNINFTYKSLEEV